MNDRTAAQELVSVFRMMAAGQSHTASVSPGSTQYVTRNIKTKLGAEFTPEDVLRIVEYTQSSPWLVKLQTDDGRKLALPVDRAHTVLRNFPKPPSLSAMQRWSDDGVAKAVDGARVEPDGYSMNNAPSWMLVMGVI
jgi:hypothetical protein